MGNIHLVTGFAGKEHISSADQGAFNASIFGNGQFVFTTGNKLAASVVTNNLVRVTTGDILMQGRHIRIEDDYVDIAIENGTQSHLRHDLIVARYTKDNITGIEDCNLVVIKGTAVESNPADPAYTSGDILNGAAMNEMPLYRVVLNGLTITNLVPLFSTTNTLQAQLSDKAPGGFGLGKDVKFADDCAKLRVSGWYGTTPDTLNNPPSGGNNIIRVDALNAGLIRLTAYSFDALATLQAINIPTGFGAWEWINPPMQLGVEYRTTERRLGKAVYAKAVDCESLLSTGVKNVSTGIAHGTLSELVECTVTITDQAQSRKYNTPAYSNGTLLATSFLFSNGSAWYINLDSRIDMSTTTAKAILRYTKTTD